jgi:hypothetical protein
MWQKDIIKILVLSASLALYKLVFEGMYISWLESQGVANDFGTTMLGYIAVISVSFLVTWAFTRPMKKVKVQNN